MFDCEKGKHVPDLFYLRHMRANWTQMRVTGCIAQRQVCGQFLQRHAPQGLCLQAL